MAGAEVDRAALLAALRLQMEWGADEALADLVYRAHAERR